MCWMKGFLLKSRDDKLREDQLQNHLSKSKIGTINLIMEKILSKPINGKKIIVTIISSHRYSELMEVQFHWKLSELIYLIRTR